MQGQTQVIDALNRALTIELTAINQYFCQAKMCANWGFLSESEEHVDWAETQLFRIEKVGIENYLSEQMGGHDR